MSSSSSASSGGVLVGKSDKEIEELLDRMLTRLALCEDGIKLQTLLSNLLPLSISSLNSSSSTLRAKVIEILSHVNKRVKHQPDVGLPLSDLWKLYMDAHSAPMVKNFSIVYIEMAFKRTCAEEKEAMAPILVANLFRLPPQHQEIILRITIKVIGDCHQTQINEAIAAKYKAISGSPSCEIFLEFCLHTILIQQLSEGAACPPGLSRSQRDRICGKQPLESDALLTRKLGILNVVEAMDLTPEVAYTLYITSCTDSQETVAKKGEELIKKKASSVNLDDANLIRKLFFLFNGSVEVESISPESRVNPGNPALRARLMSVLCRSLTAANSFPSTLQCIFSCMYGKATTSRLKHFGMEFTVWVFKHARIDQLKLMGPVILNGILKSLDGYSTSESDAIASDTRSFSYQAIGLIAQRMPQLFSDNIDMAARLFNALKLEAPFLRLVIQDATNSLAAAYRNAPTTVLKELEALLLINSQLEQSEARFCAIRWATTLFDLDHCPSRFICMLGAGDPKLDIREMAYEGLRLGKDLALSISDNCNFKYPRLGEMLDYILNQQPALLDPADMTEMKLLFPSKSYVAIIKFLLKCFVVDVKRYKTEERISEYWPSVEKMCLLLEYGMAYEGSAELHSNASSALIIVGSYFPEIIASRYAVKLSWLKRLLGHTDYDTRGSAAQLLGIASHALPISESNNLICEQISFLSGSKKQRFEMQHGAVRALGYTTADYATRKSFSKSLLQNSLKCLVDVVNSETASLASVAMESIGLIGLRVPLSLYNDCTSGNILTVLREKLSKLLSGDDTKAIQKIVIALGHMSVKESSTSQIDAALALIYSLSRSKVEDVLFAAGEALSFFWGGVPVTADVILKTNYTSLSTSSNFLMVDVSASLSRPNCAEPEHTEDSRVMIRSSITQKVFDELLYSSRKEERCAGTVWLVSLTMYCGCHLSIQQLLPEIQEAFTHLLAEQNELTQELASQGLSIIYDLGDASMKKNLVNALVGTLTGSGKRKRAIKLVEDSEVFQEGTIGESVSGGKLSTYKELCDLANEMGQPDLIYKFMDLANHQASLNSKRGAAFGFSKIAKQAGDALHPHLRLLIPRLVRYQYDPDKNVQDAMVHIWKALVADSKRTIEEHLDHIFEELLTQIGSRLWRSREASCLALADVIQALKFNQVKNHLERIWSSAFRAMDDIKETVRNSGDKLCRSVTSLTMRLCDVSLTETSQAREAMNIVLPLLLTGGMMSKVDNIRKASIAMVTKLAKVAGIAIRAHLPDLVGCMLESLSSLEDQGLNYVELHAANVGLQSEKLENLRISIAKSSPMWETLDRCIDVVDTHSLELLVPRLAQLIRSGVGLNTRVGVASFISLLVQKVGADITPFTSTLLKLLFQVTKEERGSSSRRAFANACAIVLKYSAPLQAQRLIEDTSALRSGDRSSQIACADLLKSYSSMASDILNRYHAVIIPVIFISRFEDDKNISNLFEELWEENLSSERVTLQLYVGEIVALICEGIMSSSWAGKRKSALAIVKLSEVMDESLSDYQDVLLKSLLKEIPGRLWEGKDALLQALAALCSSCHRSISVSDPATPTAILGLLLSACTKKAKKYRETAFCCLEKVIKVFNNPDIFNVVFPSLIEMCKSITLQKSVLVRLETNAAEPETDDSSLPSARIVECMTSCIGVGNVSDILGQQKDLVAMISDFLSPGFPWTVKMTVFLLINELCLRLEKTAHDTEDTTLQSAVTTLINELFHIVSPKVVGCLITIKIAQVHVGASECLLNMAKLYKALPPVPSAEIVFNVELLHQYEAEKNEQAKSFLKKCIDILGTL